jgi:hypothetical protein
MVTIICKQDNISNMVALQNISVQPPAGIVFTIYTINCHWLMFRLLKSYILAVTTITLQL